MNNHSAKTDELAIRAICETIRHRWAVLFIITLASVIAGKYQIQQSSKRLIYETAIIPGHYSATGQRAMNIMARLRSEYIPEAISSFALSHPLISHDLNVLTKKTSGTHLVYLVSSGDYRDESLYRRIHSAIVTRLAADDQIIVNHQRSELSAQKTLADASIAALQDQLALSINQRTREASPVRSPVITSANGGSLNSALLAPSPCISGKGIQCKEVPNNLKNRSGPSQQVGLVNNLDLNVKHREGSEATAQQKLNATSLYKENYHNLSLAEKIAWRTYQSARLQSQLDLLRIARKREMNAQSILGVRGRSNRFLLSAMIGIFIGLFTILFYEMLIRKSAK